MEVSVKVGESFDHADHKAKDLFHEQRRQRDGRKSKLLPMSAVQTPTKRQLGPMSWGETKGHGMKNTFRALLVPIGFQSQFCL